jgi:uncharacterized membrane protein
MDVNIIILVINLVNFALYGGLMAILPRLTRKSYLFGVKIPAEESGCPEVHELKSRYSRICIWGTSMLLLFCVMQSFLWPKISILVALYSFFPLTLIFSMAFFPCWKRAVRLKAERGWKVSGAVYIDTTSTSARGSLSNLPWAWYAAGLAIVLAGIVAAIAQYPELPDMVATSFSATAPRAWAKKSWLTVLWIPLLNVGVYTATFAIGIALAKAKLQIDPNNPQLSFAQHQEYRKRMGLALAWLTLAGCSMIAYIGLAIVFPDKVLIVLTGAFALLVLVANVHLIIVAVKSGQSGCLIKINMAGVEGGNKPRPSSTAVAPPRPTVAGRGDDKYWVLGFFYYNPDDPAYLVGDRFGLKLGFNFARLPVQIGVAIFLLASMGFYVWFTLVIFGKVNSL